MGAVYRATDTRLGREVALKILPEKLVRDGQRMGRFQREAEVLASLNHPYIGIIHGFEETGDVRALVLELVEGPTLAERIAEGPIPLEDALRMALEIAQALEAAHERGIVHGHLKPSNAKITPEGTVKVLDFGLARALEPQSSQQERATSATLTLGGTPGYMSPEQARGQLVDKRTDIWSFGLVLFEMLTGKAMYTGKNSTETLATVIHQEPSLEQLPPDTPQTIRMLLQRCLRKDSRMRIRDMGDVRIRIDECLGGRAREDSPPIGGLGTWWKRLAPWTALPVLMVLAWVIRGWSAPIPEKPISRWEISAGEGQVLYHRFRKGIALSPDASLLAFVASSDRGQPRIYLRSLDRWDTVRLSDDTLWMPFFSPDGKWLGAISHSEDGPGRRLKKYPVKGGPPTTICECPMDFGASWGSDGSIIVACQYEGGLWRVSDSGGEPKQITQLDPEASEIRHQLPHLIPGTDAVLFTVLRESLMSSWRDIAVKSLETGERKVLIERGSDGCYVASGHLVFAREAALWAAPFDRAALAVTGSEFPILEGVSQALNTPNGPSETSAAQFTVSPSGSLAYIGGSVFPNDKREIVLVDRQGKEKSIGIDPARYHTVRFSPDDTRVALDLKGQIWTYDLNRGGSSIQTSGGSNITPIWSPNGLTLVFGSDRSGSRNLFSKAVDGLGGVRQLSPNKQSQTVGSWSPDGTKLAFNQVKAGSQNNHDILVLSLEGSRSVEPFLANDSYEMSPEFHPDGRWLAYVTGESGQSEVYVQRYPEKGARQQISVNGGLSPVWGSSRLPVLLLWDEGAKFRAQALRN